MGEARGAFHKLCAVWRHANLSVKDKLRVFDACVVSKLLYSLECECLLQGDRRRLDGFYAQCLRSLQRIEHSMYSHISNEEVLTRADRRPLTVALQTRQLILFGHISLLPGASLLRTVVFVPDTVVSCQLVGQRRRGRPRMTWTQSTYAKALQACNHDASTLHGHLCGPDATINAWKMLVRPRPN